MLLPALLGEIGSSASEIIVTAVTRGKEGLHLLFGRLGQKASPAWYILAFCAVPAMLAFTLAITGTTLDRDVAGKIGSGVMIGGVAAMIEEFGWRGFALPALQKKYNSAIVASILLGSIWASWHTLPSYWGSSASYGPLWLLNFLIFALSLVAYSVFLTWIFNRTRGSMLIAILLHTVYSGSQFILFPLDASPVENIQLTVIFMAILWPARFCSSGLKDEEAGKYLMNTRAGDCDYLLFCR